jgi:hypothetical protein
MGEELCTGKTGEAELSPLLFLIALGTIFSGGVLPPLLRHPTGGASGLLSLFSFLHVLIEDVALLWRHHFLGQIGTPWFTTGALETLRKAINAMKI